MAEMHERGETPHQRDMFLTGRCLVLAVVLETGVIPPELLSRIVRTFPSIFWFSVVDDLIDRYMSDAEVFSALLDGLNCQVASDVCLSCVDALRLYRGRGRRVADRELMAQLKERAKTVLAELRYHPDPLVLESLADAVKWAEVFDTADLIRVR